MFVPIKFDRVKADSSESVSEVEDCPGLYDTPSHSTP